MPYRKPPITLEQIASTRERVEKAREAFAKAPNQDRRYRLEKLEKQLRHGLRQYAREERRAQSKPRRRRGINRLDADELAKPSAAWQLGMRFDEPRTHDYLQTDRTAAQVYAKNMNRLAELDFTNNKFNPWNDPASPPPPPKAKLPQSLAALQQRKPVAPQNEYAKLIDPYYKKGALSDAERAAITRQIVKREKGYHPDYGDFPAQSLLVPAGFHGLTPANQPAADGYLKLDAGYSDRPPIDKSFTDLDVPYTFLPNQSAEARRWIYPEERGFLQGKDSKYGLFSSEWLEEQRAKIEAEILNLVDNPTEVNSQQNQQHVADNANKNNNELNSPSAQTGLNDDNDARVAADIRPAWRRDAAGEITDYGAMPSRDDDNTSVDESSFTADYGSEEFAKDLQKSDFVVSSDRVVGIEAEVAGLRDEVRGGVIGYQRIDSEENVTQLGVENLEQQAPEIKSKQNWLKRAFNAVKSTITRKSQPDEAIENDQKPKGPQR